MNAYYNGKLVIVQDVFAHSALIVLENYVRKQVPLRTLIDATGTSYEHITIPQSTPPEVLADRELARVGRKNLYSLDAD